MCSCKTKTIEFIKPVSSTVTRSIFKACGYLKDTSLGPQGIHIRGVSLYMHACKHQPT